MMSVNNGMKGVESSSYPPQELSALFAQTQRQYLNLENDNFSTQDPQEQQKTIADIFQSLSQCALLTRSLSLLSKNETLDELPTAHLRYLLINAYLGDLILKVTQGDRRLVLETAKSYLDTYLDQCECYEVLKPEDKKYVEEQILGPGIKDPARRRNEKIQRFKREKATRSKLQELEELTSLASGKSNGEDEEAEDIDRDLVLTLLDLYVQRSLEHLVSIKQENEMLDQIPKHSEGEDPRQRDSRFKAEQAKIVEQRLDMGLRNATGPLLSKEGRPMRPFVITNQREELRDQVFRPGWRLPTMTIDEYLQIEKERGNILQGGTERPEKPVADDNDYAAQDLETVKAREWDDFTEANPRGWGNRGNKG